MPTIDCGHWIGRRNRLPHLAGSIVWRNRWGRRFRLPAEADFHRSSKSRKRLCTPSVATDCRLPRRADMIHDYPNLDLERVWLVASRDVPDLLRAIQEFLQPRSQV